MSLLHSLYSLGCLDARSGRLFELGVAEAIMAALRANADHQGVQQWGLMSVGNLCNASECRKRSLSKELTYCSLIYCPYAAAECAASSPLLLFLSAVVALGLGDVLVAALRTHKNASGVQQWGLMAAGNLSNGSDDRKMSLMNSGVGEVLATALKTQKDHPGVQQWGL
jgi:hypothetical protein